jgi:alkylation response protein AidB-like acyl-CoA dehydrogenase
VDEDVTEEQRLVLDASARLIDKTYPIERLRELINSNDVLDLDYCRQAAELGWYSFVVPEELGGGSVSDNGVVDAVLVAYTRGRALAPDPFVGTNVVAYAVATAGSPDQRAQLLPTLLSGDRSAAWAIEGKVLATAVGEGYELDGRATFVQDVGSDGWILITASAEGGASQFLLEPGTAGVTTTVVSSLDVTRRFVDVVFERATVPSASLLGEWRGADEIVSRQLALACVLTAAESVGAMDAELALTVAYAKDRIAFGRPIGSFQAVKHLLADTSLSVEMSKAVVASAARSVGTGEYGEESASIAKALVGDSGIELAHNCFQVFGGIGYTWEHDQHLYLRRLTTDAAIYGNPATHRERLCQLSGLGEVESR